MKVVGLEQLQKFRERHADVRSQVDSWLCEVENAQWKSPQDIKERYPNASILTENQVIFNLKGNKYRLHTKVNFEHQVVLILRGGTHAEYSKWNF
jgi:mRNA interferase HigB